MKERVFEFECLDKEYTNSPDYTIEKEYDYVRLFYRTYEDALFLRGDAKKTLAQGKEYTDSKIFARNKQADFLRERSIYVDFVNRESMDVMFKVTYSDIFGRKKERVLTDFRASDKLHDFVYSLYGLQSYRRIPLDSVLLNNVTTSLNLLKKDPDSVSKIKPFVEFLDKNVGYQALENDYRSIDVAIGAKHKFTLTDEIKEKLDKYNEIISEELKKHTAEKKKTARR